MSHYSDENRFIFLHVPKNAGTSLLSAFESVMPDMRPFELDFEKEDKYVRDPYFANHYRMKDILSRDSKYGKYKKAIVFRNPYGRMVSLYNHRCRKMNVPYLGRPRVDEKEKALLNSGFKNWLIHTRDLIAHTNQVDWVDDFDTTIEIRFENMQPGIEAVQRQFGVKLQVPKLNVGPGQSQRYQDWYDDEVKELVFNRFYADFVHLNYVF